MPTTRNIKGGYNSHISSSGSSALSLSTSAASPPQSDLHMTGQPESSAPCPTTVSRMCLKGKGKPFGEFRIIREPAPQDHTTELKPIPSPPWANDSFSLASSHRLHDNTRGKGTSHARTSVECSTTGGLQAISKACAWTPPHQSDNAPSDARPSLRKAYQLRPHQTVKPRAQTVSTHTEEEQSHSGTEANTFPLSARPSRKQKRYSCDICRQIFTRSGDVRRHKESRHDNSEGCRCPFCDRVLTRQDALQRHWDKYCRKKSKRYLDRQVVETQTRIIPSIPTPVYTPGASPAQTTSITTTMGTVLDQSQINYRYLNIFG